MSWWRRYSVSGIFVKFITRNAIGIGLFPVFLDSILYTGIMICLLESLSQSDMFIYFIYQYTRRHLPEDCSLFHKGHAPIPIFYQKTWYEGMTYTSVQRHICRSLYSTNQTRLTRETAFEVLANISVTESWRL